MSHLDWPSAENVTAIATVVTAVIAAIAALTGAIQYWRSRSIAELEASLRLQSKINSLAKEIQKANRDEPSAVPLIAEDFLEMCEIYAASYCKGSLPSLTREFVRDFLRYDLLPLIDVAPYRDMIRVDPARRNHLKYVRQFAEMHGYTILSREDATSVEVH